MKNGLYYLKIYSLGGLALLICLYSLFQAQKIIQGPQIKLDSPLNGATYTTSLIEVKGVAKNITLLLIDNNKTLTDLQGNFSVKLLLTPGYNIINLEARDKFGAKVQKKVEVILQEPI
jgi:Glucodextranase, domain B